MKFKFLIPALTVSALALAACDTTQQNVAGGPQKYREPSPETGSNIRRTYTPEDGAQPGQARAMNLDGARTGRPTNLHILEQVAARTRLEIDYGGGLRSIAALKQVRDAGAALFSVGSVAGVAPDEFSAWVDKFGADNFLVGADVRDRRVAVHGWKDQTAVDLFDFLRQVQALGINQFTVTDIARDGELSGPAIELYTDILANFPDLYLVASGGVSNIADLEDLIAIGCAGAIVGKAFFEGKIPMQYFRVYSKV